MYLYCDTRIAFSAAYIATKNDTRCVNEKPRRVTGGSSHSSSTGVDYVDIIMVSVRERATVHYHDSMVIAQPQLSKRRRKEYWSNCDNW